MATGYHPQPDAGFHRASLCTVADHKDSEELALAYWSSGQMSTYDWQEANSCARHRNLVDLKLTQPSKPSLSPLLNEVDSSSTAHGGQCQACTPSLIRCSPLHSPPISQPPPTAMHHFCPIACASQEHDSLLGNSD